MRSVVWIPACFLRAKRGDRRDYYATFLFTWLIFLRRIPSDMGLQDPAALALLGTDGLYTMSASGEAECPTRVLRSCLIITLLPWSGLVSSVVGIVVVFVEGDGGGVRVEGHVAEAVKDGGRGARKGC